MQNKIIDTFWDESPIDVTPEANFIWSIANKLRGSYMPDKYGDVIIPMVIIRRFECALQKTKAQVIKEFEANPNRPAKALCRTSGFQFYNTSGYDLTELCNDSDNIAANFKSYIGGFSTNVQDILNELEINTHIDKMDKDGCLFSVVKAFSELDLSLETFDSIKMGYIFENLIGRFFQNVDAGQFYTGRDIIKLLVEILMSEGCDDIFDDGKVITVCDQACGTGGMLSTAYNYIKHYNPTADVRLFGQEFMGVSYAVGLAEMLIKNQNSENFRHTDTFKEDCFENIKMRFVIENPPFGTPWSGKDAKVGQEDAVRKEHKKGETGRWGHGLPDGGDSQLIFMQSAIDKMDEKYGRAAIIENSSSLMSSKASAGESQIRRWMLEEDLIEAIIALPSQLFYNTDIGIYAFIISKNKRPDRRGKVQLINAVNMWKPLRKSLGKKRREIDRDSMTRITELYANFEETSESKIFKNEEFMYREYAVWQPLQRRAVLDQESIDRLRTSAYFTSNSSIFSEADFAELEEMNPRSSADEKKYQKYIAGRKFVADVLAILETNISDKVYMDYAAFEKHLKHLIGDVDGFSASRLTGIAMILSVMDKTAVVQKDKKGNIITDSTTKDTEIIKLTKDPEEYFAEEVYPHVPDAIWCYEFDPSKKESTTNKEKQGAEFPFTRFFYEYKAPEAADDLLAQFMELEKSLTAKIAQL